MPFIYLRLYLKFIHHKLLPATCVAVYLSHHIMYVCVLSLSFGALALHSHAALVAPNSKTIYRVSHVDLELEIRLTYSGLQQTLL